MGGKPCTQTNSPVASLSAGRYPFRAGSGKRSRARHMLGTGSSYRRCQADRPAPRCTDRCNGRHRSSSFCRDGPSFLHRDQLAILPAIINGIVALDRAGLAHKKPATGQISHLGFGLFLGGEPVANRSALPHHLPLESAITSGLKLLLFQFGYRLYPGLTTDAWLRMISTKPKRGNSSGT
jgi:hypothetical protein